MNELIISKVFEDEKIFFKKIQDELYLNATLTAKKFKKQPSDWLKIKETKAYLNAFSRSEHIPNGELVVIRQGGNDKNNQGTWIHKSLIILFARWLSPDFAVWCDLQIEEILKSKNSQPVQTQTFDLDSYISESEKLIKLIKIITSENAMTLHYLDKLTKKLNLKSPIDLLEINLKSYYFIPTELGKFFNKSAVEINKILEAKGFQIKENGVWQLTDSGKKYAIQLDNNFLTIKWKLEAIL
jgi:hypothetical protein